MDSQSNDNYAELPSVETPEDVAVLYSWANLHGAKYRDFSASRREYRAQLRHRAAEQARETELRAQTEAETAAEIFEQEARSAVQSRESSATLAEQISRLDALHDSEIAAQRAAAERMEATRRAEAAMLADAEARRTEREIAEAGASERRKAAMYAESESFRRSTDTGADGRELPGKISDPYTVDDTRHSAPDDEAQLSMELSSGLHSQRLRYDRPQPAAPGRSSGALDIPSAAPSLQRETERARFAPILAPSTSSAAAPAAPVAVRRPQGYRPDDASGVRQIYRAPELSTASARRVSPALAREQQPLPTPPYATRETTIEQIAPAPQPFQSAPSPLQSLSSDVARNRAEVGPTNVRTWTPAPMSPSPVPVPSRPPSASARGPIIEDGGDQLAGTLEDPTPRRRRQDQPGYRVTDSDRAIAAYRREQGRSTEYLAVAPSASPAQLPPTPMSAAPRALEPAVPAWINGQQAQIEPSLDQTAIRNQSAARRSDSPAASAPKISVADTLQRSRERVASRWYALKGVFEQPGNERAEPQPVRQKETRTPVLAIFSFAGGVGKTSLVATLGRSLSSLGEKVLLTDTTSHGLLPFYFGASELRAETVRTFSPPSGSTDAPIYLVNYAVDQLAGDEAVQEHVAEEITKSGRGAHRVLLDLTANTGWLIARMAHLSPTVLVPLAPDMNSIISLQAIEKFIHGINGPDGTPIKVFYVLNQFDASLPLHLDVREVLRRQLGERLLPIVIRRAPAVSEALAEGMTIIDYASDAPVAEDYLNVANWLRTVAAPVTAGFRNVRWSER